MIEALPATLRNLANVKRDAPGLAGIFDEMLASGEIRIVEEQNGVCGNANSNKN